jgi:hydroxyacylglutathione hydrolase
VDPSNTELKARLQQIELTVSYEAAMIPCTLHQERQTNPFLRPDSAVIRAKLDMDDGSSDEEVFAALRAHKDAQAGVVGWTAMKAYPVASYFGFV